MQTKIPLSDQEQQHLEGPPSRGCRHRWPGPSPPAHDKGSHPSPSRYDSSSSENRMRKDRRLPGHITRPPISDLRRADRSAEIEGCHNRASRSMARESPRFRPRDFLRDDLADRLAEVDLQPLAAGDLQPARVEAELVQDRGVDVGDVVAVLDGVEAELVGRAVDDAALDAAAGQPDREAVGVVVAAVAALRPGRAAELGRPDDQRLVEQAALLQVLRAGRRSAGRPACRARCGRPCRLPWASQAPAPPLLPWKTCTNRTPRSTSRRAARHCSAERPASRLVQAVELAASPASPSAKCSDLGHRRLHPERQLVRLDPGPQRRVVGVLDRREPVQLARAARTRPAAPRGRRPARARRTAAGSSGRRRAGRRRARGRGSWPRGRPRRRSSRRAACPGRRTAAGCRSASPGRSGPTSRSSGNGPSSACRPVWNWSWAPWLLSVVHIERTTAMSSMQSPTCGHQSLTSMPLCRASGSRPAAG